MNLGGYSRPGLSVSMIILRFDLAPDSTTEEISKSPSLKERSQQANSRCTTVVSPSVTNSEQRSVADQPVIKPSQSQNKNTTCDSGNESGAPSSLPRRKRVLPNLGSASRRRHSSVSKENVEKIVVARCEEIATTDKDIGHVNVSTCKDDIKALF